MVFLLKGMKYTAVNLLLLTFVLTCFSQTWTTTTRSGTAAPRAALGYDFNTGATQISWRVQSNIPVDMYLVDVTNFNLMKNGAPFVFQWSALNAIDVTGPTYTDVTRIRNTLLIAIYNKNTFSSATATFTLRNYVTVVDASPASSLVSAVVGGILGTLCLCYCICICVGICCGGVRMRNRGGYYNDYSTVDPNIHGHSVVNQVPIGGTTVIDGPGYNTGYGNNSYGTGYTTVSGDNPQGGNEYR